MGGQRIGYVSVSTLDQNEKRQLEGQVLERVFTDKASGRDTARPQLEELRAGQDACNAVVGGIRRHTRRLSRGRLR